MDLAAIVEEASRMRDEFWLAAERPIDSTCNRVEIERIREVLYPYEQYMMLEDTVLRNFARTDCMFKYQRRLPRTTQGMGLNQKTWFKKACATMFWNIGTLISRHLDSGDISKKDIEDIVVCFVGFLSDANWQEGTSYAQL